MNCKTKKNIMRSASAIIASVLTFGQLPVLPAVFETSVVTMAEETEKTITLSNVEEWENFANEVNNKGNLYMGFTVKLTANIDNVTTSVGTEYNPFKGIFDGGGHTLNVNLTDYENEGTAPFRAISSGAVIKNLTVTGTTVGGVHSAGLVGFSLRGSEDKPNIIDNCVVKTNVSVNEAADSYHIGGVVGHGKTSYLEIKDTVYKGTMTSLGDYAGGLQGWSDGNHLTVENSVFDGTHTGNGEFYPIAIHDSGKKTYFTNKGAYFTVSPTLTDTKYIAGKGTMAYTTQDAVPENAIAKEKFLCGKTYIIVNGIYITNLEDWNEFAESVSNGSTFQDMFVTLKNDITVSTPVGTSSDKFKGIFNGGGHTLTFNYTASGQNAAPFLYAEDASFRCVKIDGTVSTAYQYAAGLVAHTSGDCFIKNSISNITINSSLNGHGNHGGFVSCVDSGTLTFENCLFSGRFAGDSTTSCCGFVGFYYDNYKVYFTDCLMTGGGKESDPYSSAYGSSSRVITTNCYAKTDMYYSDNVTSANNISNNELAAKLGTAWKVDGDNVIPIIAANDISASVIDGAKTYYRLDELPKINNCTVTASDGTLLVNGTDYKIQFKRGDEIIDNITEYGDYTAYFVGIGDYAGKKIITFSVGEGKPLTKNDTVLYDGYTYVVNEDLEITERLNVEGNAKLILKEGTKLLSIGIEVNSGDTLTIDGEGTLEINSYYGKSGIGSGDVGTIIINGGHINVKSGDRAAAIGGDANNSTGGTVIINGGEINAQGGEDGSAIGGGYNSTLYFRGLCPDITVNGGKITARGGLHSYGIGPGTNKSSGKVTIGWTNEDDYIDASFSDKITELSFMEGKRFVVDGTSDLATIEKIQSFQPTKIMPYTEAKQKDIYYTILDGIEESYIYTGEDITISPSLTTTEGLTLVENTHYTVDIIQNGESVGAVNKPGDYTYIFTATEGGGFTGTKSIDLNVKVSDPYNLKQTDCGENFVTIGWEHDGAKAKFTVEYADNKDFSNKKEITVDNENSATITNLGKDSNIYYTRVKAISNGVESNMTDTCTVYTSYKKMIGIGMQSGLLSSVPLSSDYEYSTTQQIYTSEEIGEENKKITSISFLTPDVSFSRSIDIYMTETEQADFDGKEWIPVSDTDKVFSGTVTFNSSKWTTVKLDKPFAYTGNKNLSVLVDDNTNAISLGFSSSVAHFQSFRYDDEVRRTRYSSYTTDHDPITGTIGGSLNRYRNIIVLDTVDPSENVIVYKNAENGIDGVTNSNPTTYKDGDSNISLKDPERIGYVFGGWYDNEDLSGEPLNSISLSGESKDLIIYAKWTANAYNVVFDANNGEGTMEAQAFEYGTEQALTQNAFTRDGYKFTGWNTEANGTGTAYDDKAEVSDLTDTAGGNVTLYAQWLSSDKISANYMVLKQDGGEEYGYCIDTDGKDVYLVYKFKTENAEDLEKYSYIALFDDNGGIIKPIGAESGTDGYDGKYSTVYKSISFGDDDNITAENNQYLLCFKIQDLTSAPKNFEIKAVE